MSFYSSGNDIVDAVGKLNLSGDVTPRSWLETLVTENKKPYFLAIHILADIVYWYRPTEIRDEETGSLIGWKKKFEYDDFLQRNYEPYEDMFKESTKTIRRAFDYLEDMGLIKRHKGTVTLSNGDKIPNRIFIELIPKKLEEITYPIVSFEKLKKQARHVVFQTQKDKTGSENGQERENEGTELSQAADKSVPAEGQICPGEGTDLGNDRDKRNTLSGTNLGNQRDNSDHTNTENTSNIIPENTTKNTTIPVTLHCRDYNPSINPSVKATPIGTMDKMDRESLKTQIRKNINYDGIIQSLNIMDRDLFEEMYILICDIVCYPRRTVRVNNIDMPYEEVRDRFLSLNEEHLQYAVFCISRTTTKIRDVRAYLITTLYRAPETISTYYSAMAMADMHGVSG